MVVQWVLVAQLEREGPLEEVVALVLMEVHMAPPYQVEVQTSDA